MAVIIEPDNGNAAQIGKQLLELADSPYDVQWVTYPVAGFKVPEELAIRLQGVRSLPNTEQPAEDPVGALTQDTPRRRAGRPRKTTSVDAPVLNTDDTEQEE